MSSSRVSNSRRSSLAWSSCSGGCCTLMACHDVSENGPLCAPTTPRMWRGAAAATHQRQALHREDLAVHAFADFTAQYPAVDVRDALLLGFRLGTRGQRFHLAYTAMSDRPSWGETTNAGAAAGYSRYPESGLEDRAHDCRLEADPAVCHAHAGRARVARRAFFARD